jgi:hypothetical protein
MEENRVNYQAFKLAILEGTVAVKFSLYIYISCENEQKGNGSDGQVIALAVSRRLPTAADRVRSQVRLCRICCGKSGTGAAFLLVFPFPLPILIPQTVPHPTSTITRGWYSRPNTSLVLSLIQHQETKQKIGDGSTV